MPSTSTCDTPQAYLQDVQPASNDASDVHAPALELTSSGGNTTYHETDVAPSGKCLLYRCCKISIFVPTDERITIYD